MLTLIAIALLSAALGLVLAAIHTWKLRRQVMDPVEVSSLREGRVAARGVLSSSDDRNALLRDATGACDLVLQQAHVTSDIQQLDGSEALVIAHASDGARHGTGYRSAEARLTLRGTPSAPLIITALTADELRRELATTAARMAAVAVTAAACAFLLLR